MDYQRHTMVFLLNYNIALLWNKVCLSFWKSYCAISSSLLVLSLLSSIDDILLLLEEEEDPPDGHVTGWIPDRSAKLHNDAKIGVIGSDYDATYQYQNLGQGADALKAVLTGNDFSDFLKVWSWTLEPQWLHWPKPVSQKTDKHFCFWFCGFLSWLHFGHVWYLAFSGML